MARQIYLDLGKIRIVKHDPKNDGTSVYILEEDYHDNYGTYKTTKMLSEKDAQLIFTIAELSRRQCQREIQKVLGL